METKDVDPSRPLRLEDPEKKLEAILSIEFHHVTSETVSVTDLVHSNGLAFLRDLAALAARVQKLRGLDFDALAKGLIAPGNGVEGTRTEGETVEDIEAKVDNVSADVGELGKEHNILQAEIHRELDKLSTRFEVGANNVAEIINGVRDRLDVIENRVAELEGED